MSSVLKNQTSDFCLNSFKVKYEPFDRARSLSYGFQIQHVSLSRINSAACLMEVFVVIHRGF